MCNFLNLQTDLLRLTLCLFTAISVVGLAPAQQPDQLALEKMIVQDSMAVNKSAFNFLKPEGWQAVGTVKWYPNHWHQACLEVQVTNPGTPERLITLPYKYYTWIHNPLVPIQKGVLYMGQELQPLVSSPTEYAQKFVIPSFPNGQKPTIVCSKEMPQLAKVLSDLHGFPVRFAKVRVEYQWNGQAVEEDFYVSLCQFRTMIGGSAYDFWGPAWPPFALRAAKGQLDAKTPLLMSIADSFQVNSHWYAEYLYVCDLFKQRLSNGIQNAANLSKYIADNNEQIFQMNKKSWELQQATQDKLAQKFSDAIMGVTSYKSKHHTYPVQLPSNYSFAWQSSSGEYLMSNNPNFNPNVGSIKNWDLLKPAK